MQAAQAVHAAVEYTLRKEPPETVAVLAAADELDLCWLCADAERGGFFFATFREPGLGDALTAVALGPEAARLCRKFPLALMEGGEQDGRTG